jgi:3-oxoacyl-[acyl-carrier-protein] synthase-3
MKTAPAFEVRAQCSGFIYALNIARSMVIAGQYRRILVCGVEVHSRALDMSTRGRDVSVLFGDGAGAVLLEASDRPESGILPAVLHAEGEYAEKLWVEAPRLSASPHISAAMIEEGRGSPKMDGKFVFKHAVVRMPEVLREVLDQNHLGIQDIDHFFFHQANLRINEYVCQSLGIPAEKTWNNIERFGNCSAASIPMCLDEANRAGRIKSGDILNMTAFGAGFCWGSVLIRW